MADKNRLDYLKKYQSTKKGLEKQHHKKIDVVLGTTAEDSDWRQELRKKLKK